MKRTAKLSKDKRFCFSLGREWDTANSKRMTFVMLNPSTADTDEDDATVRRCIGFAQREGCGSLAIVNLFSYRTASPRDLFDALRRGQSVQGILHNRCITEAFQAARQGGVLVFAWGDIPASIQSSAESMRARAQVGFQLTPYALGLTKNGNPRHPLRLAKDTSLERLR